MIRLANEPIVYQANPLIEGQKDFSLIETRLFYIGLRDLVPKLTKKNINWNKHTYNEFPTTIIPAVELVELFGNKKYYSTLQGICEKMAEKTIKIKRVEKKGWAVYPVFAELSYTIDEGLRLEFNPKMTPWLLDLADKPFTKLPFEQIWALRSPYSIRLFELVLQYQNAKKHERNISVEDLRLYLGVPDGAYADRMNNFKRFVIDNSIKDINEKTAYKIEVETVKEKRRIVAFKFKLHLPAEIKKEKRKKQIENIGKIVANTVKTCSSESAEEEKLFQMTDEQAELGKRKYAELMARLKASE